MQRGDNLTKKKNIVIVSIILLILIGISLSYIFLKKDNTKEVKEEKPKETIILKENLNYEINSEITLLSLVNEDNKVKILSEDKTIDTSVLGEKEITIKYEVEEKEETKTFKITIIDTQAPTIEYKKELTTNVGTEIDLLKDVKIIDNSKENIKANVIGDYDFNKEGTYNLKYVAIDSSGNKKEDNFTLKVNKKQTTTTNTKPSNNSSTNKNNTTSTKPSNNKTSSSSSNETNKDKPWEKYGMTENQYYNEPMWSWAKVDFSIEKYGTKDNCVNACREYGLNYELYKQGKVLFGCRNINSISGKYLGEMFYTEDLK